MEKSLTVYKASAGSGKTFTLATEYIKLLIENPLAYKNILAVTFTNKATEEMKMRIISKLYGIAHQLPDSESYLTKIEKELSGYSRELIAKRAEVALGLLIHNYNYFQVETIDAFFQTVLRNLARELDLTANLRIDLNDIQVEQKAVDKLIESLSPKNKILDWIMGYIDLNISDGKNWNVIRQIKDFGKSIFQDQYKAVSRILNEKLSDNESFKKFTCAMQYIKKESQNAINKACDEFYKELEINGLTETDFKRGLCTYFRKLKEGNTDEKDLLSLTILGAMEDPLNWVVKKNQTPGNPILTLVQDKLFNMLRNIEEMRPKLQNEFKSADLTLKHLDQLRLLNSIEKQVHLMNEESNRFLLSDTQTILNNIIEGSDSPFIFEKIGTRLNNIMIDEFQDTSLIQWENFKFLLNECMSKVSTEDKAFNMIVGDVKQSIYRWRNGDWRLLNDINAQFPKQKRELEIKTLDTNFRSEKNIISFNNAFFEKASTFEYKELQEYSEDEAEQMKTAYSDVRQDIPKGKKDNGLVHIELFNKTNYDDKMLSHTKKIIETLLNNGIKENDIAILMRDNKSIQDIVDYVSQEIPNVRFVSNEAFHLSSSSAVCILINALHVLSHPEDTMAIATLAKSYQKNINEKNEDSNVLLDIDDFSKLLPQNYISERESLMGMPLYDLVERLFLMFNLQSLQNQSAYICAFFDMLSNYITDNGSDIDAFINAWDDKLHDNTIQSDYVNGIRILTIHKSKGLEFDNVIMPYCDWIMEQHSTIWCEPKKGPYNYLPLIPVDYSKQMIGTIYENDYKTEHLQNMVDNMNLLYVAFTRARKNLFVLGKNDAKSNCRSITIKNVLSSIKDTIANCKYEEDADNNSAMVFEYGKMYIENVKNKDKSEKCGNVFETIKTPLKIDIETFLPRMIFRQSNDSKDFIENDEEKEQNKYIKTGCILHNIFSTIQTSADIPSALKQLETDGLLYDDDMTRDSLVTMIKSRLENEPASEWFSGKWKVLNECSILSIDPETNKMKKHRPDRVMIDGNKIIVIDFKFGKPQEKYHEQVNTYMTLIKSMGYKNVKGYLWFVYTNNVEEVK